MPGTTVWITRSWPLKLMSRILSQNSSSVFTNGMKSSQPALLTTTSIGPRSDSTEAIADLTESSEVTLTSTAITSSPPPESSFAVCSATSRFRSAMATRKPASASEAAMPRPMPWAPPVTKATRLLMGCSLGWWVNGWSQ